MIRTKDSTVSQPTARSRAAVVVLAAGRSSRMGVPKALLMLGNETFLDRIVSTYAALSVRPIVVLSPETAQDIRVGVRGAAHEATLVVNRTVDGDRFSSVLCGLAACEDDEFVFLQDVDRPFVTADLVEALFESRAEDLVVAPDHDGHAGHPLLVSPDIARRLLSGERAPTLRDALRAYPHRLVTVGSRDHETNINTPSQYRRSTDVDDTREELPG